MESKTIKHWSSEDIAYLRDHYLSMTDEQLGLELGRTAWAVRGLRHRQGFIKVKEGWKDVALKQHPCDDCKRDCGSTKKCAAWEAWFRYTWRGIRAALGKEV